MKPIALALLAAVSASAQATPDARDLLARSDGPIMAANTVRLEGTLSLEVTAAGQRLETGGSFSLTFSKPSQFRHVIQLQSVPPGPNSRASVMMARILPKILAQSLSESPLTVATVNPTSTQEISNGANGWIYYPESNTYQRISAAVDPSPEELQYIAFGRDPAHLGGAALTGEESLDFGGRQVLCAMVRAEYTRMPVITGAGNVVRTVWIERERGLLLRDSWEGDLDGGASSLPHFRLVRNYSTIEWDRPLPAELFAFQPPAGSRPVQAELGTLVAPPELGRMGLTSNDPGSRAGIGGGVYRVGGGVSAPTLLYKVELEYSEEARQAKYQGTVVLYVEVDPSGSATNIKVVRGLGLGLDQQAIEAVRRWQFKPGYRDGKPVTVAATIEVNFRLLTVWRIARQEYFTNPGVSKPSLRSSRWPPDCKQNPADITVAAEIGADGQVADVQVVRSTEPSLDQPTLEAVRTWVFLPAQASGTKQAVRAEFDLACKPRPK